MQTTHGLSAFAAGMAAKTGRMDSSRWLPLWMHLRDTAETMRRLVRQWLPEETVRATGMGFRELTGLAVFLGATHDIGKATFLFENEITKTMPERWALLERAGGFDVQSPDLQRHRSPHAMAGEAILLRLGCPADAAAIVGAHHGKPQELGERLSGQIETYTGNYCGQCNSEELRRWEKVWTELLGFALELSGFSSVDDLPRINMSAQVLLTGLLIMADWIASNTDYYPLIPMDSEGRADDYPRRAERAWGALALPEAWAPDCPGMDGGGFLQRFGFSPNRVQTAVTETASSLVQPGIIILEAQMGVGKTEAALAAAEILGTQSGAGGVVFALPTQATANGIFRRLESWAASQSETAVHAIRLAHGMASLNEDYRAIFRGTATGGEDAPECGLVAHGWFDGPKQALLANFVIGTIDQVLMAGLKQKHVMLRHLGLAGKIVIIDECHAYDAYMTQYLDIVLTWLGEYGVPVILLSATLPSGKRTELVEAYLDRKQKQDAATWKTARGYPLLTWTDGQEVFQRTVASDGAPHSVKTERLSDGDVPAFLRAALAEGGCAGVIVNTVKRAQSFAALLRELLPDCEVAVIHAQYLMPDRAAREAALTARLGKDSTPSQRDRLIVVGTQVLEQSLDIDFDVLITDLCPMDLLMQRIGRLHRHERARPARLSQARCAVLGALEDTPERGASAIYGELLLLRTRARLPETVMLPGDIPELVQDVYDMQTELCPQTEKYRAAEEAFRTNERALAAQARTFRIGPPKHGRRSSLNSIHGWLYTDIGGSRAEAAVRSGDASIEVILLVMDRYGRVRFLPWQNGGREVPADRAPSEQECVLIYGQRIRLPGFFSQPRNIERTIDELQARYDGTLAEWKQSAWLGGESVLLLDESLSTEFCGYRLTYTRENGLKYEKYERKDELEGIGI